eukprot:CAMPEP_0170455180 /NCGR_PEP_ID=MMETSP0123-20130129/3214_1 /TAXON_ID=182087 /ORGANISM="Favella ehrenbergii, Strain Fehren 1" /LENGTH=169 /DNA_ID=CAMNT_0010718199 /DNA_START=108 /DNA_END=619 /DNA_ORIENTATION=-
MTRISKARNHWVLKTSPSTKFRKEQKGRGKDYYGSCEQKLAAVLREADQQQRDDAVYVLQPRAAQPKLPWGRYALQVEATSAIAAVGDKVELIESNDRPSTLGSISRVSMPPIKFMGRNLPMKDEKFNSGVKLTSKILGNANQMGPARRHGKGSAAGSSLHGNDSSTRV